MSDRDTTHSKACLAAAVIAAVENLRDVMTFGDNNVERPITVEEFRATIAGDPERSTFRDGQTLIDVADSYLASKLMDCRCHVANPNA